MARSLQGIASSCIAVAGMGMIAKMYDEDQERSRSSSSHVFTIPESTNLRFFFAKFSLFCLFFILVDFFYRDKNANTTVCYNRKRHFAAL
jgi:hypothetical protein